MQTLSTSSPAADDLLTPRLILRDGSVTTVRTATASDRQRMRRFFHELSPESRRHRFFIAGEPPDEVVERFCTAVDPAESLTLVACRRTGDEERIVAVASYFRITGATAEAAFAVAEERRRLATMVSLAPLFAPRAVAVVGASRDPASIGGRIMAALAAGGCSRPVHPVNLHGTAVDGRPAYRSARELPAGVDLAIVAVPAAAVLGVVDDCAAAGVKALVVVTAGFAEVGTGGRALQEQLVERVRGYGMRMVGRP